MLINPSNIPSSLIFVAPRMPHKENLLSVLQRIILWWLFRVSTHVDFYKIQSRFRYFCLNTISLMNRIVNMTQMKEYFIWGVLEIGFKSVVRKRPSFVRPRFISVLDRSCWQFDKVKKWPVFNLKTTCFYLFYNLSVEPSCRLSVSITWSWYFI